MIKKLSDAWREAWTDRRLRLQIVATPFYLILTLRLLAAFLIWVEERPGAQLSDPLLESIVARDGSLVIFAIIYLSLVSGLAVLASNPRALVIGVQAYVVMILSRICVMYFTALDPPANMVPLRDPVIEWIGTGRVLTRDLFFSGHTATIFLLCVAVPGRRFKLVFLACTIAVAIGVIRQHAHYT
ncbi:MAG: hypothetical protein M3O46_18685, partial [Myxococcota bacterium]|nr:hypothetical protein [Myxococcota bacterium]